MKDLSKLADMTARITADNPEIAEQSETPDIYQPVRSANRNPNMRLNPDIELLRRSPRLNTAQNELLDRPSERQRIDQSKQAPPRVPTPEPETFQPRQDTAPPRVQQASARTAPPRMPEGAT